MKQDITDRPERSSRGTIRMSIPASVAYDPDGLKKSLAQLAERIGCGECMSGADCLISMERDFVLDARQSLATRQLQHGPTRSATVDVGLSSAVSYDIDRVFQAIDKVIDLIGAHPCISGFDIAFKDRFDAVVIDRDLGATSFLGGF